MCYQAGPWRNLRVIQSQITVENPSMVRPTPQSDLNTLCAAVCHNNPEHQTDLLIQLQRASLQIPDKHSVKLPGQTPHQPQVVFSSRNKMTAVICELQASDVLVVTTEDREQPTCGHLNRSHMRNQKYDEWRVEQKMIACFYIQYLTMKPCSTHL